MNIINGYARPVLLFPLTAAKDHQVFNQMVEWEKWFLSLGIPKDLQWKMQTEAEILLTKGQKKLAEQAGVSW